MTKYGTGMSNNNSEQLIHSSELKWSRFFEAAQTEE